MRLNHNQTSVCLDVSQEEFNLLTELASAEDVSLEDWMFLAIQERAMASVQFGRVRTSLLTDESRDRFLAMLDSPPAPTEALRAAAMRWE